MGMRFRKSKKIAPGVRLNLSAKSASISIGPKGFKKTFSTSGRVTTTVGIPGTGLDLFIMRTPLNFHGLGTVLGFISAPHCCGCYLSPMSLYMRSVIYEFVLW